MPNLFCSVNANNMDIIRSCLLYFNSDNAEYYVGQTSKNF